MEETEDNSLQEFLDLIEHSVEGESTITVVELERERIAEVLETTTLEKHKERFEKVKTVLEEMRIEQQAICDHIVQACFVAGILDSKLRRYNKRHIQSNLEKAVKRWESFGRCVEKSNLFENVLFKLHLNYYKGEWGAQIPGLAKVYDDVNNNRLPGCRVPKDETHGLTRTARMKAWKAFAPNQRKVLLEEKSKTGKCTITIVTNASNLRCMQMHTQMSAFVKAWNKLFIMCPLMTLKNCALHHPY